MLILNTKLIQTNINTKTKLAKIAMRIKRECKRVIHKFCTSFMRIAIWNSNANTKINWTTTDHKIRPISSLPNYSDTYFEVLKTMIINHIYA